MALGTLLRHHLEAHVGARRHARHVQPDGGGVGRGVLDRAGLGIAGGDVPRGDLAHEVVAPAAVAEQAVGLLDGDPPGEIGEGVPGAALALGDEAGVQGCVQLLRDGGGETGSLVIGWRAGGRCQGTRSAGAAGTPLLRSLRWVALDMGCSFLCVV